MATSSKPTPALRYAAPTLEKGLDIIELLAGEAEGLAQSQIAKRLSRSPGEIFRMLGALEARGYVHRRADGAYHLTLRLFELAHGFPPTRRLLTEALPVMRRLADGTGHGCHLCVYQAGRLLVIAAVECPGPMGFSVKVGGHFPLRDRTSGRVIAAFAHPDRQVVMLPELLAQPNDQHARKMMLRRLSAIRARGYELAPSDTVEHVVDISFPVLDHTDAAIASLTMPLLGQRGVSVDVGRIEPLIRRAAAVISSEIGGRVPPSEAPRSAS